ncbi:unnamed protein product [Brassica oleracea var. botrytis]
MDRKKIPPSLPPSLFPPKIKIHRRTYEDKPICPLSHLALPHVLVAKPDGNTTSYCFSCGEQKSFVTDRGTDYYCTTCDVEFHRGCHKFPRKLRHPYHPQHPLTFTFRNYENGIISDGNIHEDFWRTILSDSSTSDPEKSRSVQVSLSQSDLVVDKCTWCENDIEGSWFYRCSIFHQRCIDLPRVIKITRHKHRLSHTLYIEPLTSPCRICYKPVDIKYGQYSCSHKDCSYVAHSKCATHENVWDGKELEWEPEIYDNSEDIIPFKKVGDNLIKHFSHEHILKLEKYCNSPIPRRPTGVIESALWTRERERACDGEEIESDAREIEREAAQERRGESSTARVSGLREFSAELRFSFRMRQKKGLQPFLYEKEPDRYKYDGIRDGEKQCRACVLPINSRDFYNCVECDFFLHEVCAGLLRKLDHALHVHPLVLYPYRYSPKEYQNMMGCSVCSRKFSGFTYICPNKNCGLRERFQIDVRCTLVPDYFTHESHEHPLFISTSYKGKSKICKGCKKTCMQSYLNHPLSLCIPCSCLSFQTK